MKLQRQVFQSRIAEVERVLAAEGAIGLVVYATGSALGPSSRTHGYMRYLCDWDSHHAPSMLVLKFGRPPTLIVPNIFMVFLARKHHWIDDVRFVKVPDFPRVVAEVLTDAGIQAGKLGLVGRNEMPAPVWEGLHERVKVQWLDATPALDRLRVIKDACQIAMHERAAEICDSLFATLAREIRTPKPAYQLQADMERTARYAGCEYCMTWMTVMPKADYSRFFKDECSRVPQVGDQVFAGIYLIYEGHWGHAIRGGTFGSPSDEQRRTYGIALEMENAMLEKLVPGGDLNEVHAAAERVLLDHYGERTSKIFRFRHGHALGLSYEDPAASLAFPQMYDSLSGQRAAPVEVMSGMLFEFHPNLFVPDIAGAVVGDMVAVTPHGPRILNVYPRNLIEW
jgi:Xaa-Pro aminopeptidase